MALVLCIHAVVAAAAEPRIVASWAVPRAGLSAGVRLGGLSDLAQAPEDGTATTFWALTDRGPNGTVTVAGEKVRSLLAPDFVPALVRLRLEDVDGTASVGRIIPLLAADGRPVSGRPPGGDRLVAAVDHSPVAVDPDGVDPEGLVALSDGSFWVAEEYRPALLHVGSDGRLLSRFVPRGSGVAGDRDVLPAALARRRENRGFEALAVSPDERRLWAIVQSPLEASGGGAGGRTGNVRLLAFDVAAECPAAEYVYRLGDPADPAYLTRGAPPDDGKLCAMAALDAATLLVLEQDDGGLARLYAIELSDATDTRAHETGHAATLEEVADLTAAGIVPPRKSLVADLTGLRQQMRADVDAGTTGGGALKLEGLAIVDPRHVAVVNDDDFGVPQAGGPGRGTRVWIVELPTELATFTRPPP